MTRTTFGSIETVIFEEYSHIEAIAKIDTGAWSGALHCTSIKEVNGRLEFNIMGDLKQKVSTTNYTRRQVKNASGHVHDRYLVPIVFLIKGKTYRTTVGLTDRSTMQREMLLGRKFLIENNIIVDVTLTLDDDYEAEKYL